MKCASAILVLMLFVSVGLSAAPAKVVYTDGPATARLSSGKTEPVKTGRSYDTGDSIRTGKAGEVELSQEGLTIRVGPSTVFTLMEKELGGKTKSVLAVTLGMAKLKYERLTGTEPIIQSVGCSAGVRGTELSIVAGDDGASLIVVDSGLVTVEAGGKVVDLGPGEAVEVINGKAPGQKFVVYRDQIDYQKWGKERLDNLLADPLSALTGMRERLSYYAENVSSYLARQRDVFAQLEAERDRMAKVREEKGKEAADTYEKEFVTPLVLTNSNLVLNYRYFGLAALSMRRFVGGRMYLLLKLKYLANPADPAWIGFVSQYEAFIAEFDSRIMPVLVDADF